MAGNCRWMHCSGFCPTSPRRDEPPAGQAALEPVAATLCRSVSRTASCAVRRAKRARTVARAGRVTTSGAQPMAPNIRTEKSGYSAITGAPANFARSPVSRYVSAGRPSANTTSCSANSKCWYTTRRLRIWADRRTVQQMLCRDQNIVGINSMIRRDEQIPRRNVFAKRPRRDAHRPHRPRPRWRSETRVNPRLGRNLRARCPMDHV